MSRESHIEQETCAAFRRAGCECVKVGRDGWPDQLVLLRGGRHVWIELKQPRGRLRAAQRVRVRDLRAAGDRVVVVDSIPSDEAVAAFVHATRQGAFVPLPGERFDAIPL